MVIPSRGRPALLARLLDSLVPQVEALGGAGEIIVVDDGSEPAYAARDLHGARLVRGAGRGPSRARNRGVAESRGEIVAFTDDDVVVHPGWVEALLTHLDAHPAEAGVSGRTTAPPHDPLFEHAVEDLDGQSCLTCNVAYRASALAAVGGFDELFARAHEDRDLAWRIAAQVGPVGFCGEMVVDHPGRPFGVREAWSRARFCRDDWLLFARYPGRRAGHHSDRLTPMANHLRRSLDSLGRGRRSPRRIARALSVTAGQLVVAGTCALVAYPRLRRRDVAPVPGLRRGRLRVAYLGPSPDPAAGGAPGVAGLLVDQLVGLGCSVECFVAASREDDDPRALSGREGLSHVVVRSRFAFGRWYSRGPLTKFVSLQAFAALARRRLARELAARHAASPYDVLWQFSTLEGFGVPRRRPPLVVHPSVHAAGERRWLAREADLGMSDEPLWRRRAVWAWLGVRVRRQRRDARRADGVLALSRGFGDELVADYGVDEGRVRVVPNCVEVPASPPVGLRAREFLVVGRVCVRKGLEDVVALSHRLAETGSDLRLRVIGAPSLWSDYSAGLGHLDPATSAWEGPRPRSDVLADMARATGVLQLSRYEPFGLTVAESLAAGTPVVVTGAVGAAEEVADDVKLIVGPGDLDALVAAVTSLAALRDDERDLLAFRCRREAERLFAPRVVAERLLRAFDDLVAHPVPTDPAARR